jgi:hypothetical protein
MRKDEGGGGRSKTFGPTRNRSKDSENLYKYVNQIERTTQREGAEEA